jgi:hypothetical protein
MARNLALWLILVLVFLWVFSFLRSRPTEDLATKKKKALEIGADYIKTHYGFDIRDRKLLLIDKGATWDMTYEVPKDRIGGAAGVTIDKQTLRILGSYFTQ